MMVKQKAKCHWKNNVWNILSLVLSPPFLRNTIFDNLYYCIYPKYVDRKDCASSVDPGQATLEEQFLIRVYIVCHSFSIFKT